MTKGVPPPWGSALSWLPCAAPSPALPSWGVLVHPWGVSRERCPGEAHSQPEIPVMGSGIFLPQDINDQTKEHQDFTGLWSLSKPLAPLPTLRTWKTTAKRSREDKTLKSFMLCDSTDVPQVDLFNSCSTSGAQITGATKNCH